MCRVFLRESRQNGVKSARKVVKKYRQMSYKKEMLRLRNILSAEDSVSESEVLDRTVSLIQELESRLISQLRQGNVPHKIAAAGVSMDWNQCSHDNIRNIVAAMMTSSQSWSSSSSSCISSFLSHTSSIPVMIENYFQNNIPSDNYKCQLESKSTLPQMGMKQDLWF